MESPTSGNKALGEEDTASKLKKRTTVALDGSKKDKKEKESKSKDGDDEDDAEKKAKKEEKKMRKSMAASGDAAALE